MEIDAQETGASTSSSHSAGRGLGKIQTPQSHVVVDACNPRV